MHADRAIFDISAEKEWAATDLVQWLAGPCLLLILLDDHRVIVKYGRRQSLVLTKIYLFKHKHPMSMALEVLCTTSKRWKALDLTWSLKVTQKSSLCTRLKTLAVCSSAISWNFLHTAARESISFKLRWLRISDHKSAFNVSDRSYRRNGIKKLSPDVI